MQSVGTTPVVIRGQRQHADHPAGPVIRMTMCEKRAVAAIVLDHEQPKQEASCGYNQHQTPPISVVHGGPGQCPEKSERNDGNSEFEGAASSVWFTVAGEFSQGRSPEPIAGKILAEVVFIGYHTLGVPARARCFGKKHLVSSQPVISIWLHARHQPSDVSFRVRGWLAARPGE